jgi:hypothetical protein
MPTGERYPQLAGRLFFRGKSMKTFWLVESSYYDDGTVQVRQAGSIQAEKRPDNEKLSTSEAEIHRDWYGSVTAAKFAVLVAWESKTLFIGEKDLMPMARAMLENREAAV